MRSIYLVSCVGKKRAGVCAARDLYNSPWFRKARALVEKLGEPWQILSAKYGLLDPDDEVEPYEVTLNGMPAGQRREWAQRVLAALTKVVGPDDQVVILAGARYREFLIECLERRCTKVVVPMEGLGIGEQLAWLSAEVAKFE